MPQKIEVAAGIKTGEFAAGAREIVAETQRMAQGVEGAGRGFQGFGDKVKGAFAGLSSFAKAAGIAVTIGAVTTAVTASARAFLELGDSLNKTSQKLGVSVEALSQWRYAANLSDVSFQQLERGMFALGKNIEKAATGNKKAAEAFSELGISLRDAEGNLRPISSVMVDLSAAFQKMPDGAEKAAVAAKLFALAGKDMIPLLNQGPEGIKKLADEADRLGVTMSSSAAAGAEKFNDAWTKISQAFGGAQIGFWSELVVGAADASDALANFIVAADGMDGVGSAIGAALGGAISAISTFLQAVYQLSRGIVVGMAAVVEAVTGINLGDVFSQLGTQFSQTLTDIYNFVVEAKKAFEDFLDPAAIRSNVDAAVAVIAELPSLMASALQAAFPQVTAALQGLFTALQPLGAELSRIFSEFGSPIMEGLNAAWQSVLPVFQSWDASTGEALSGMLETYRSWASSVVETLRTGFDQGFAGMIEGVTTFVTNLTSVLQTITLDNVVQLIQAGVEQIKALFGQLAQQIPPLLEQVKQAIAQAFQTAFDNAMSVVQAGLDRLYGAFQAGVDRIKGLWNSVTSLFSSGGGAVTGGAASPQQFAMALMAPLSAGMGAVSRIGESTAGSMAGMGAGIFQEYVAGVTQLGQAAAQATAPVQQLVNASTQLAQTSSQVGTATKTAASNITTMGQQGAQAGQQLAQSLGSTIGSALAGIVSGTTKAKDAFKQMLGQILQQVIQFMMNQIMQQFMKGFMGGGGMGGGLFGGLFGGGGGGIFSAGPTRALAEAATALSNVRSGRVLTRAGGAGLSDLRSMVESLRDSGAGRVEVYNSSENNVDLNVRRGPDGVTIEVALSRATQEVLRGGTPFSAALEKAYGLQRNGY